MACSLEKSRAIKLLLNQAKSLKANVERALIDSATPAHSRFVSFKMYAETYNSLAIKVIKELKLPPDTVVGFDTARMKGAGDMLWGSQKQITETVAVFTDQLITFLEDATDYIEDEFDNVSNFIKSALRASMFSFPDKEIEVQDNIERLFIGKGMSKGIDYDRESGKLEFSGKEYIPDFILPKLNLCIEVKLLKEGKRSRVIDEINADITAYSTKYERMIFVVYDLGVIRDENEFRRDIENAGANIKVIIVKH